MDTGRRERGSLTVETLLFLIPFMFAFLTLINMARFVQAEMLIHHAITQTAKQISTYSYVLTKMEITDMMQSTNKKSQKFKADTQNMVNSVTDFVDSMGNLGGGNVIADVTDAVQKADTAADTVTSYFSEPKDILYGALAVVKSGVREKALTWAAGSIARGYIRESIQKVSDDPDEYLRNIGVVDGLAGLDFSGSKWITNTGGKADIEIVVTYKLKNLLFPDFDFGQHEFQQCASTLIW